MTRATLSAANRGEIAKAAVHTADFIELRFPSGTVRCTTAARNVTWGGFSWLADARYARTEGMAEKADFTARRTTILLSGADAALITKVMTDNIHFYEADIYVGFFDANWVLVADPHPLAKNLLMSQPKIHFKDGTAEISISAEQWTLLSRRSAPVLATPQTQRKRYAADTGQDKLAAIMDLEVQWGGEYADWVNPGRGGVVRPRDSGGV